MTTEQHVQRKPYRISEFAEELGVAYKTVARAIKGGRIRSFKINEMILIPPEEMGRVKAGERLAPAAP